jgi:polar amino acid transport system permease protein
MRTLRWAIAAYVDFIRGTPLLIQIFLVFFALPVIGIRFDETRAGIIALAMNTSAYIAETVRGGVGSIERGQTEAARSIGMTHAQILAYILLPQALRPIVPPLTNELISMTKNSSLLSVISVYELTRAGQAIISVHFVPFEIYLLLALYYYAIIKTLSWISKHSVQRPFCARSISTLRRARRWSLLARRAPARRRCFAASIISNGRRAARSI